jgi:biopolymer transport protein ExbD
MPMKIPEGDIAVLNMTPMIDIVFNLVTFFMLTLDMSQKELAVLDLPRANNGVEDKEPSTIQGVSDDDKHRFVVNIQADGSLYFKGKSWPLEGATVTPEQQTITLDNLRKELRALVRTVPREPEGASKAMVLVRGDRTTKWRYVQWIMQVCADPQIKIYKMHFGVEHKVEE